MGINSMLAKEAEARLTIPAMAEKVRTLVRWKGDRVSASAKKGCSRLDKVTVHQWVGKMRWNGKGN